MQNNLKHAQLITRSVKPVGRSWKDVDWKEYILLWLESENKKSYPQVGAKLHQ